MLKFKERFDQNNSSSLANFETEERQKWYSFLRTILLVLLLLTISATPLWAGIYLFTQQLVALFALAGIVGYVLTCGAGLLIIGIKSWKKSLEIATGLVVVGHLAVISWTTYVTGATSGVVSLFFWTPIFVSILGLSLQPILYTALITIGAMIASIAVQGLGVVKPVMEVAKELPPVNIFLWCISLFTVLIGLVIFTTRLQKALVELKQRLNELARQKQQLDQVNEFGVSFSHDLSGATNELSATAHQHNTGVQEQVAAVSQVATSLEELSETANQIAASALGAAQSAELSLIRASEVKQAAQFAEKTGNQGKEAVEQTILSVERVRNRIELLGQRLLTLTEQTRKVSSIIDLIDEISDETHLLALNASIEAAGNSSPGGQTGLVTTSIKGERFGVIAQEVKNLADRSRESTEEVRQAITEMQGAVAAAVLVAEEGKKETAMALARAQIAGAVINKLDQVIAESAEQAEEILKVAEEVKVRADEIKLATSHQRTASQQVVQTTRSVAAVSRESANAVGQIYETITWVNKGVGELNEILTKAREPVKSINSPMLEGAARIG
jgi:methyl-accepting chemotaxis protein